MTDAGGSGSPEGDDAVRGNRNRVEGGSAVGGGAGNGNGSGPVHELAPFLASDLGRSTDGDLRLPEPRGDRYAPLRGGIVNLWQYEDQEFRFEAGHLLLRGENGMGKSKALELLLPFLIDANLAPERLDPFGDRAKKMRWNLLEDGAFQSRIGYVWLEFGRLSDGGSDFVTLGAGLRATQSTTDVDSWYFVTRARRGAGFDVVDGRVPLTKDRLRQALAEMGTVYDTAAEYRRAVDAALFDLGEERYAAIIELLLALRRPQLSKTLDPVELSKLLATSLPPLDPQKIARLADAFEQLERLENDLAEVKDSHDLLAAFLEEYRGYARIVAARAAKEVIAATTRFDNVTRRVRLASESLTGVQTELRSIAEAEEATDLKTTAAQSALSAFESSGEMQGVHALQAARDEAERAETQARGAAETAGEAEELLQRRGSEAAAATEVASELLRLSRSTAETARSAAGRAAFEGRHEAHEQRLLEDPEDGYAGLRAAIDERYRILAELRKLGAHRDEATRAEAQAEHSYQDASSRAQEARSKLEALARDVEAAIAGLDTELERWRATLFVLQVDDGVFGLLREAASAAGSDVAVDHNEVLRGPAQAAVDGLAREIADQAARIRELNEQLSSLFELRAAIEQQRDDGPARLRDRPGRASMAGAPLWLLCDFAPRVDQQSRAAIEAALEDSGLLEAWVTPEGRVVDAESLDVFFTAAPVGGPTLADVLVPEAHREVGPETIAAVLQTVALGRRGSSWIEPDGSWGLGPLTGRWAKDAAEHIGAAAREGARRRRLAELDERIGELEAGIAGHEARLEDLERRRELLAQEIDALPSAAGVVAARVAERVAASELSAAEGYFAAAATALDRCRRATEKARRVLSEAAGRHGLDRHVDRLSDLGDAMRLYGDSVAELRHVAARAIEARAVSEKAERDLEEAAGAWGQAREARAETARAAAAARARADALHASIGEDADAVLRRRDELRGALADAKAESQDLAQRHADARELIGRAEVELSQAEEDRRQRDEERAGAAARLAALDGPGVLRLVVGAEASARAESWSVSRSLEVARRVSQTTTELAVGDDSHDAAKNRVSTFLAQLHRDLGSDLRPNGQESHGVFVVAVEHRGREFRLDELVAFLADEVANRSQTFDAEERRVVEQHLLRELGLHLQSRLTDAERSVRRVNSLLQGKATASGLSVKLRWRPSAAVMPGIEGALALLRKELTLLTDEERDALARFLQQRIQEARADDSTGSYADHLSEALDYRRWHSFELLSVKDGREHVVTKKRHGTGSGGEKAVVLHLPLFAAAAAHYDSAAPYAPRLIMLDEAFAGIDQGMRGKCIGLIVDFDLDLVMTSHDEWGCYPEIDGLSIYQLWRDPSIRGVGAIRFVWNGTRRVEDVADAHG